MELYNMPCAMFQILYTIALKKTKSEEGKQQIQAEEMEDALEEGGLIP